MNNKFSNIKGLLVKYVDSQGVKKEDFYKKISMNGQSWRGEGAAILSFCEQHIGRLDFDQQVTAGGFDDTWFNCSVSGVCGVW